MHSQHTRTLIRRPSTLSTRLVIHPLAMALHVIIGGACFAALALPTMAMAQAQSMAREVDIAAGPLATTLNRIGESAGLLLSFDPALVKGKTAPAIKGRLTAQQALVQALAGSGLAANADGASIVIKTAPPAPVSTKEAVLPLVTVRTGAERETATGPVQGYVATRSATGTKTDTPIIETPQSISVIGAQEIEVQKPQSLTEAFGYSAGVFRSEDYDSTRDQMRVRGFDLDADYGSYFRDGMKYTVNGFNGQQEPYGLERIELLRGASSVLYGLSAPGGLVNTVSKRPTTERLRELNVEFGSFQRKQVSGDFGGALTEDGSWSYRLTALYRDANSFIDYIPNDRTYIAPALKWQPSAVTSLTLLSEYQKDRSTYSVSLPSVGTLLPNPNGRIPRNRFVGEPGYDKFDLERYSVGYLFEHAFTDQLKLRHNLRYFRASAEVPITYTGSDLSADQRTASRSAQDRSDSSHALVSDTSLQFQWQRGEVVHTTIAGVDVNHGRHQSVRANRALGDFDFYAPVYGTPISDAVPASWSWKATSRRSGLYAQDQMKIGERWVVTVGGRQDWVRSGNCAYFDPSQCTSEKDHAFTGRAGVVYLAPNGLAPFVGFSQAWEPTSGNNASGQRLEPTKGQQIEVGLRYQPNGSATMLSATVYQLERRNVAVSDAAGMDIVQLGEARSRGLELEATARLTRQTTVIASYAYTDAKTVKSSPATPELDGKRVGGVPRHQASVWGEYTFGDVGLPGLKVGVGVRHVGSATGVWTDLVTPPYTLLDAMVAYTTGNWRFAANLTNLTDKTYLALCPYGCYYGEPRKVIGTATYRW